MSQVWVSLVPNWDQEKAARHPNCAYAVGWLSGPYVGALESYDAGSQVGFMSMQLATGPEVSDVCDM